MEYLNIIINNKYVLDTDRDILFPQDEEVIFLKSNEKDMFDLLIMLGAFSSRSQARKNWSYGQNIPVGWSEFSVGKLRRQLCIWNPGFFKDS